MREADHTHPRRTNPGRRPQVGSPIEGIARPRLGRHKTATVADFFEPARAETVDQQCCEPLSRQTARPLAVVRTDAVAAMQNDNGPCRCRARRQIKLGRRIAEWRPNFGRIKDLCSYGTGRPTEEGKEEQGPTQTRLMPAGTCHRRPPTKKVLEPICGRPAVPRPRWVQGRLVILGILNWTKSHGILPTNRNVGRDPQYRGCSTLR
jgi:hypothetical protein